ncbi:isopentenyl-diphosphate delta-isomerase [Cryobacterium psychrotolerans]|uniref:Isopentenyl-diphosphate Delta-isomerase n=1 Tax=Cryobacterium psychrotolerans TaxID=386301 RepID=A0A1G8YEE1_9MICO|nr:MULTISPECIES: isopentenyl-diphosphate Delta-isomerase [Cryobacterium]TFD49165.1 isopentenyl-diphosphate Delta-isomerase [Cryobacterium sp. TMT1-2-1]TFD90953.1 isopentenyl-diphosphate Delta-isomerase [Cryobacterium psychrotolerans]SDK01096.1 isopentenyl-diphosphate delta-isomerase [Cryobacterium psychrotolerans]
MQTADTLVEHVILLDQDGREIGTAPKESVHGADTSFHLAFSCYVFNDLGEVLMTRRALGKKAWPGVWTNSFCGHPLPAEPLTAAVTRRARFELGLDISAISVALPLFRYRATDSFGTVENELCPVYVATTSAEPEPNPREVMEYRWADPTTLRGAVRDAPWAFSPWLVLQVQELDRFRA